MNDELKRVVDKLEIVKNLAQSAETQQVCSIIIELVRAIDEKKPMGFIASESKRPNKSQK